MVISVKAWNWRKFEKLEIKPNGESFFLVGDREVGKSSVIELILSSLQLIPFPTDALREGAESGGYEVVHRLKDTEYTVTREFAANGKLKRFTMVDKNGASAAPSTILTNLFGTALVNAYFDYQTYFYGKSSSAERFEYFMKAIGGVEVQDNNKKIRALIKERNTIGGQRETSGVLVENSNINPDTLKEDKLKYEKPKVFAEAYEDPEYLALKEQLIDEQALLADLELIKKFNNEFDEKTLRLPVIDTEIADLEKKLKALKDEKKTTAKWLKDNPQDKEYQAEVEKKLAAADEFNGEHEIKVQAALSSAIQAIADFNAERNQFDNALVHIEKYLRLDQEWGKVDAEITELKEKNQAILREKVLIPELSIDDENDLILYEGRELCFPKVSKGRSIQIAAQIQRAINPDGCNMIVISEAQSMGSGLDETIVELKKFDMQYIMEVTERKQPFKMIFEDEYLKKLK